MWWNWSKRVHKITITYKSGEARAYDYDVLKKKCAGTPFMGLRIGRCKQGVVIYFYGVYEMISWDVIHDMIVQVYKQYTLKE